jgi:lipid-binding SYLF domain-containing protein
MKRTLAFLLALLSLALGPSPASASAKTDQRLDDARRVFESFSNLSEQAIPTWLLERAYGVVVIPDVIKGALIIGGRGGKGVMAVRKPDGTWSNPVFVTLAGANIGFQWGVQSTDVVFVLMSRKSVEGIAGGKVTLGADASVAAGPIGRSAAAATDATLQAQVLAYSRSEGIFAGVSLDGSVIAIDNAANESAYGVSGILASQILEGQVASAPLAARDFTAALERATTTGGNAPPGQQQAVASPETMPRDPTPPPPPSEQGAQTFPMEDPNPGTPPPQ